MIENTMVFEGVVAGAAIMLVSLVSWLAYTVSKLLISTEKSSLAMTGLSASFVKLEKKMEEVITKMADITKHERDIKDLNEHLGVHRKSIKATERFLGIKYGAEYLEIYEKVQDSHH